MNILHIITSLEFGGAQRLLSDILPLLNRGNKITLLVYKREHNEFENKVEKAGINIISLDENNFHNPMVVFKIRKFIKQYDLVHVHLFPSLYWVALASIGTDVPLVYTEHSTSNSRRTKGYFRPIEKWMYSHYKKLISISQQTQDALSTWLQSNDERFVVVNNGVDISKFEAQHQSVIPKSLIMVSRFASSKDQETVIKAIQYVDAEATLRFVGDGENREKCEQLANSLGLLSRIEFLGSRSDVAELLSSSMIGIQSSNWEGFGLTAVEIMASGKPVIATNVDGLKQVVEGAGFLFEKGDAQELARIINALLSDSALYEKYAKQSLERAKKYDISYMAEAYTAIYNEVVK